LVPAVEGDRRGDDKLVATVVRLVLVSINRWRHDDSVAAAGAPSGKTHGQEHVLVIEDDDGVRRFIVDCLQSLGYTVSEASGGLEGLAQIRTETPELLIVDYPMPGLNGVDVINQSRAAAPDLPIILATGYADMDAVHRVVNPSQVLRKPFQIGEREIAVRRALAPHPKAN
jgi:CheY-like chemotaxis protein